MSDRGIAWDPKASLVAGYGLTVESWGFLTFVTLYYLSNVALDMLKMRLQSQTLSIAIEAIWWVSFLLFLCLSTAWAIALVRKEVYGWRRAVESMKRLGAVLWTSVLVGVRAALIVVLIVLPIVAVGLVLDVRLLDQQVPGAILVMWASMLAMARYWLTTALVVDAGLVGSAAIAANRSLTSGRYGLVLWLVCPVIVMGSVDMALMDSMFPLWSRALWQVPLAFVVAWMTLAMAHAYLTLRPRPEPTPAAAG